MSERFYSCDDRSANLFEVEVDVIRPGPQRGRSVRIIPWTEQDQGMRDSVTHATMDGVHFVDRTDRWGQIQMGLLATALPTVRDAKEGAVGIPPSEAAAWALFQALGEIRNLEERLNGR
jgi:hypothetical protein